MAKPIQRGYYGGLFFEFILQDRKADAMIILPDFPCRNSYNRIINLFYGKGYHVFVPRYRGSYQSSGKFLLKNIVDDIIFFVKNLEKGEVKSLSDMKKYNFRLNKKILMANGFGGAIACGAAAKYPIFSHLMLISPIWDFSSHNKDGDEEDLQKLSNYVKRAYRNCYRYDFDSIVKKITRIKEVNPSYYLPKLELPVLIMHDPNDKRVSFRNTKEKIFSIKRATLIEHYLGHDVSDSLMNAFWKDIDKFIKINYVYKEEAKAEISKSLEKPEDKIDLTEDKADATEDKAKV